MGAEFVDQVLNKCGETVDITICNRGRAYFDSKERVFDRLKPEQIVKFDRQKDEINEVLSEHAKNTDIVVDFSCFSGEEMTETIGLFGKHIELYIYISTDSVYEVCTFEKRKDGVQEVDSTRPKLARRDSYEITNSRLKRFSLLLAWTTSR